MGRKENAPLTRENSRANLDSSQRPGQSFGLARTAVTICLLVITATLSACSASTSTASPTTAAPATVAPQETATSMPAATATSVPTAIPTATSIPQQAVVTTQLDPCQLIDSQEASALAGTTFNQGVEGTTPGGMKMCTYGGQTTNILTVEVIQAPDVATAQKDKAQFLADLQSNLQQLTNQGLNVTQVPNFADGAISANASINANGIDFNGKAFAFLKGTVFFGFSDLVIGGAAPTDAAMQAEATTVLGRLPQ